jgi:hypothetical protein
MLVVTATSPRPLSLLPTHEFAIGQDLEKMTRWANGEKRLQ